MWFSLLILTLLRLASSCLPFVLLLFSLSFRTLIWDNMLRPQLRPSSLVTMGYLIFTVLSLLPVVLLAVFAVGVTELFIPLMGRVGAIVSSDVIMAIVSSILTCLAFMSFVSCSIYWPWVYINHFIVLTLNDEAFHNSILLSLLPSPSPPPSPPPVGSYYNSLFN